MLADDIKKNIKKKTSKKKSFGSWALLKLSVAKVERC